MCKVFKLVLSLYVSSIDKINYKYWASMVCFLPKYSCKENDCQFENAFVLKDYFYLNIIFFSVVRLGICMSGFCHTRTLLVGYPETSSTWIPAKLVLVKTGKLAGMTTLE